MKNLKPTTITFFIAVILSVAVSFINLLFDQSWPHFLILLLLTFVLTYFLVYNAMQIFIYRKIKLIYKSIHTLKLGKDDKAFGEYISDDPMNDVEKEVQEWAFTKRREIEDLKRMEQFRREFLANVSHELKTPLFTVQGYIHTLLDGAMDDPEVSRKFLEKCASNVERLCLLADDLGEITRAEKGEIRLAMESFDINKLVKEIYDSMEMKARQRKIHLTIKKGTDRPFFVNADKERIRQVLTNLVDNSIKYGKEGGETTTGFYDMADNILIEITDDGPGIDEEHLPRLFERFYRVDKSRSRDQGGTGLGLAIVKHLIEAHNQVINVRSTTGIGSTFGFTLQKSKEKQ
jgi:two-component system phosphate regulon sensor histidine kinase PhoR